MSNPEPDYEAVIRAATAMADAAIAREAPEDPRALDCGFAWVTISPARGPLVTWCRKNKVGSLHEGEGWVIWCPGSFGGQSVRIHRAAAVAYAQELQRRTGLSGITASSRLD